MDFSASFMYTLQIRQAVLYCIQYLYYCEHPSFRRGLCSPVQMFFSSFFNMTRASLLFCRSHLQPYTGSKLLFIIWAFCCCLIPFYSLIKRIFSERIQLFLLIPLIFLSFLNNVLIIIILQPTRAKKNEIIVIRSVGARTTQIFISNTCTLLWVLTRKCVVHHIIK